jgi:uncharacterized membrane protein YjdF
VKYDCRSLSEGGLFYVCFEDFIFMCHEMILMWTRMRFISVGSQQANVCVGLDGDIWELKTNMLVKLHAHL